MEYDPLTRVFTPETEELYYLRRDAAIRKMSRRTFPEEKVGHLLWAAVDVKNELSNELLTSNDGAEKFVMRNRGVELMTGIIALTEPVVAQQGIESIEAHLA